MMRIKVWPLLRETGRKWNADNCLRLGASLAYYTLFSLFPLILIVLTIIRVLLENSDPAREAILSALGSITGGFHTEFAEALQAARQARLASGLVGTAALLLGASWVFGELVSAFNIIWEVEPPAAGGPLHFLRTTFFSFALVFAGAFLLLVSMILSAILTALGSFLQTLAGGPAVWQAVHLLINLGVLTGVFSVLFKYLPTTEVRWRDVKLAALLTAIIWSVLQLMIASYIAFSGYANYGAIGAILALVAWVYLSSQIVFLGGEFSYAYARQYGSRAMPRTDAAAPEVGDA